MLILLLYLCAISERTHCECTVTTYFVELYNEQLVDLFWLLDSKRNRSAGEPPKLDIKVIIREGANIVALNCSNQYRFGALASSSGH